MLKLPEIENCIEFAKACGATNILEVPIVPHKTSRIFQCHANCKASPILGYYIVEDSHGILHAMKHSVLLKDSEIIDITPTIDDTTYKIFMYGITKYDEEHLTYAENSVFINNYKEETEMMYYVYALIDPRDNLPFYIGKGKDNRCLSHFTETALSKEGNNRKTAKIRKLNSLGFDPMVEFYAQNIEDEDLAYQIESHFIKKLGRIGYDERGILTNICENNNPPNHKGKTYDEIYGANAETQRKTRHDLQLAAGGWFKGHTHSEESKKVISEKTSGKNNPRYGVKLKGTSTASKIGDANRGKKHYSRAKLCYIEGLDIFIFTNDLKDYCIKNGYSHATFCMQLNGGRSWPKYGKNFGLLIRYATGTEISSYTTGGISKDVNEEEFTGFQL